MCIIPIIEKWCTCGKERERANVYIRMREKEDVVNEKKGDGEIEIDDVCKRRRMFWETLYPIQWK